MARSRSLPKKKDSALVIDPSELVAIENGQPFGIPEGYVFGSGLACGATNFSVPNGVPNNSVQTATAVTNIHNYSCALQCTAPTTNAAQQIFTDIKSFIINNGFQSHTVMIGETDSASPDSNDPTFSYQGAKENVSGFNASGLASVAAGGVILRPWDPVGWSDILKPAPIGHGAGFYGDQNGPYDTGGCQFNSPTYNGGLVDYSGGTVTITVSSNNSNCAWSIGPMPPASSQLPAPLTWPLDAWGNITITNAWIQGQSENCIYPNSWPGPSGQSLYPPIQPTGTGCWGSGSGTTGFQIAANTMQAQRTIMVAVAGWNVPINQAGAPGPPGAFTLTSPAFGSTGPLVPTLTWTQSAGATSYSVYLGTTWPGSFVGTTTGTSYTPSLQLVNGRLYYWHVVASGPGGTTYGTLTNGGQLSHFTVVNMPSTKVGVFRGNMAFLEDSNGSGGYDAGVTGPGGFVNGDVPVTGDWTGDGHPKVGIYRASTGQWFLDANNNGTFDAGDYTYGYGGVAGDNPVVGDWMGYGKSCIGIVRHGVFVGYGYWVLDLNCNGIFDSPDATFPFGGLQNDSPVVGNWNGGSRTRVGVVRCYYVFPPGVPDGECNPSGPYPFYWVFDNADPNAGPLASEHQPAPYAFAFGGLAGDIFVTGDWNNTGFVSAGVYRNGYWVLDAAVANDNLQADHIVGLQFGYGGAPGDLPVTGKW